jgi:hypothetical protein
MVRCDRKANSGNVIAMTFLRALPRLALECPGAA